MEIKMSPKKELEHSSPKMSKAEVKRILLHDRSLDYYCDDALLGTDLTIEEIDDELKRYHDDCNIIVDSAAVKKCSQIIEYLESMGGKPAYSDESTADVFCLRVGAYFTKKITISKDMEIVRDILNSTEFSIHVNASDNNECLISFIIEVGKYIKK